MRRMMMSAVAVVAVAGTALAQGSDPTRPGQPGQPGQPGMDRPGQTQPGMRDQQQGQGQKLTQDEVDKYTRGWDQEPLQAVRDLTRKYGQPTGGSTMMIVWDNPKATGGGMGGQQDRGAGGAMGNQPGGMLGGSQSNQFRKIIVHSEPVDHRFPTPHKDFLQTVVEFKVPAEKVADISEFNGSIAINRTAGTVSATCDTEEANILALNVAHDIATGKRTADDAKEYFAKTFQAFKEGGQKPQAVTALQFRPDPNAGDPGTPARVLGAPERPDSGRDMDDMKNKDKDKDKDKPLQPGGSPSNPR